MTRENLFPVGKRITLQYNDLSRQFVHHANVAVDMEIVGVVMRRKFRDLITQVTMLLPILFSRLFARDIRCRHVRRHREMVQVSVHGVIELSGGENDVLIK